MLLALRSLWEQIYPLDEQYCFTGLLALGRSESSEASESETPVVVLDFGDAPVIRKHRQKKTKQLELIIANDDEEILALLAA